MSTIKDKMAKIKLWQEECKLVVMFFGAVTTVAVFFTHLFKGQFVKESAPASRSLALKVPDLCYNTTFQSSDNVLIISGALFIVFFAFGIYFLIKVIKKWRKGNDKPN